MKMLALVILLSAALGHTENAIVYPDDLPRELLMKLPDPEGKLADKQEFLEVIAPDYPGLKMDPLSLKNLVAPRKNRKLIPSRDPKYYQHGGMILEQWGFPMPASQIYSTTIP